MQTARQPMRTRLQALQRGRCRLTCPCMRLAALSGIQRRCPSGGSPSPTCTSLSRRGPPAWRCWRRCTRQRRRGVRASFSWVGAGRGRGERECMEMQAAHTPPGGISSTSWWLAACCVRLHAKRRCFSPCSSTAAADGNSCSLGWRRVPARCLERSTHKAFLPSPAPAAPGVAGDFWHTRGSLPVEPLNEVVSQLAGWRQPALLLPGNHDQAGRGKGLPGPPHSGRAADEGLARRGEGLAATCWEG